MEDQASVLLHEAPLHPYTAALLASRPSLFRRADQLEVIPGQPLSAVEAPDGCPFAGRCTHAIGECTTSSPQIRAVRQGWTSCIRAEELLSGLLRAGAGAA
jgi:oligopeptide/dipeptide ABC transporter ATP-binding protein